VTERCDVLLVASYAAELAGFRNLIGDGPVGEVAGLKVIAKPVGIGLVSASTGSTARIEAVEPRAVVLVGTCGAYPGAPFSPNDVVVVRVVSLVDPLVEEGRAAFPDPMSERIDAHAAMRAALAASGSPLADVATTLAITTDDALAEQLGQATGADVEQLETYGVASACASLNVPFACVLGVTNVVGSGGRSQWRDTHVTAAEAACRCVAHWLHAGAAGVPHRERLHASPRAGK